MPKLLILLPTEYVQYIPFLSSKGFCVPARNGLKTLSMFQPECTGLLQGENGNWSRTRTYTYTCLLVSPRSTQSSSAGVTRSRGIVWLWSGFLLPEGSHPATEDLKPDVLVEAFLSMGHVDLEDSLDWQFSWVFGHVHHCGLFQSDGVVILTSMLCYCWRLQHPSLACILVLLQSCLKSSCVHGISKGGLSLFLSGDPSGKQYWQIRKASKKVDTQIEKGDREYQMWA